jgi:hypothetical protein
MVPSECRVQWMLYADGGRGDGEAVCARVWFSAPRHVPYLLGAYLAGTVPNI